MLKLTIARRGEVIDWDWFSHYLRVYWTSFIDRLCWGSVSWCCNICGRCNVSRCSWGLVTFTRITNRSRGSNRSG